MAERAYALYSGWGYTAPAASTDISVDDFTIGCFAFGSRPRCNTGASGPLGYADRPGVARFISTR